MQLPLKLREKICDFLITLLSRFEENKCEYSESFVTESGRRCYLTINGARTGIVKAKKCIAILPKCIESEIEGCSA